MWKRDKNKIKITPYRVVQKRWNVKIMQYEVEKKVMKSQNKQIRNSKNKRWKFKITRYEVVNNKWRVKIMRYEVVRHKWKVKITRYEVRKKGDKMSK